VGSSPTATSISFAQVQPAVPGIVRLRAS